MKSLVYIGVASAALTMSISANAATESLIVNTMSETFQDATGAKIITEDVSKQHNRGSFRGQRGGFNRGGFRGGRSFFGRTRFFGGFGFPFGGFRGSYIRPFIGFRLPTYWINPTYFIPNYSFYNLSTPVNGQIWSRYHNDAVLRDQQGFVVKAVNDVQWQDGNNVVPTNGQSMPIEGQVYSWNEGTNVGGTPTVQIIISQGQANTPTITTQNSAQQVGAPFQGQPTFSPGVTQPINTNAQPVVQDIVKSSDSSAYERCLRGNGITGALLGTIIGGVAGNRIAGSNARTAGTLIGGGAGALGGLAVETAISNCSQFKPQETQITQEQFPQAQFPQGQVVQGQFPQAQFPQGQVVQGQFPQAQFPQGQVVQGQFPQAQFPQGQVVQGQFPQAQFPQGQVVQGQFPQAQFPQGQVVQGQFPQAQFPQGQVVQGQLPQAQFPQGQVVQGQFRESENGEYAQCLRKRGITGGVLGALLGGVAGNRIAGRNDRTAGTLIGGGLGAIAGSTIEKATRKCEKKRVNQGFVTQYFQPQVQYYWVSPGYYYPPATTTITIHQEAVQQEEIVEYETIGKTLSKPVKRLQKPQR